MLYCFYLQVEFSQPTNHVNARYFNDGSSWIILHFLNCLLFTLMDIFEHKQVLEIKVYVARVVSYVCCMDGDTVLIFITHPNYHFWMN